MFSRSIENLLEERNTALGAFNTVLNSLKKSNEKISSFIISKNKENEELNARIIENDHHVVAAEEAIQKSNKTIQNIEAILT